MFLSGCTLCVLKRIWSYNFSRSSLHSSVSPCDLESKWEVCKEEGLDYFLDICSSEVVVLWPYLKSVACCNVGGCWCSLMDTALRVKMNLLTHSQKLLNPNVWVIDDYLCQP